MSPSLTFDIYLTILLYKSPAHSQRNTPSQNIDLHPLKCPTSPRPYPHPKNAKTRLLRDSRAFRAIFLSVEKTPQNLVILLRRPKRQAPRQGLPAGLFSRLFLSGRRVAIMPSRHSTHKPIRCRSQRPTRTMPAASSARCADASLRPLPFDNADAGYWLPLRLPRLVTTGSRQRLVFEAASGVLGVKRHNSRSIQQVAVYILRVVSPYVRPCRRRMLRRAACRPSVAAGCCGVFGSAMSNPSPCFSHRDVSSARGAALPAASAAVAAANACSCACQLRAYRTNAVAGRGAGAHGRENKTRCGTRCPGRQYLMSACPPVIGRQRITTG
jgi:hypothetical protein